jgi:hypothetical protein
MNVFFGYRKFVIEIILSKISQASKFFYYQKLIMLNTWLFSIYVYQGTLDIDLLEY